jgi:hypothetical protein
VTTIRHDIISRIEQSGTGAFLFWDRSEESPSQNAARRMRKQGRDNHNSSDIIIRTHKHRLGNKRELAFGATIDGAQH